MEVTAPSPAWRFVKFVLLVTGEGEEEFLPKLFRSLESSGRCAFKVLRRFSQRSPRKSDPAVKTATKLPTRKVPKHQLVGKDIPLKPVSKKDEEIGLAALGVLRNTTDEFVILVDDLEHDRRDIVQEVYGRYRLSFDAVLKKEKLHHRAAVHFLIPMLEAYYFADTKAVNAVLGTQLSDHEDDVETNTRHPKKDLKKIAHAFDEKEHGRQILPKLDVPHILSHPDRCASLRTLFGWCVKAMGEPFTERFQLENGKLFDVTKPQIAGLP